MRLALIAFHSLFPRACTQVRRCDATVRRDDDSVRVTVRCAVTAAAGPPTVQFLILSRFVCRFAATGFKRLDGLFN